MYARPRCDITSYPLLSSSPPSLSLRFSPSQSGRSKRIPPRCWKNDHFGNDRLASHVRARSTVSIYNKTNERRRAGIIGSDVNAGSGKNDALSGRYEILWERRLIVYRSTGWARRGWGCKKLGRRIAPRSPWIGRESEPVARVCRPNYICIIGTRSAIDPRVASLHHIRCRASRARTHPLARAPARTLQELNFASVGRAPK